MNTSNFIDIASITVLTAGVVGALVTAGMSSALVIGAAVGAGVLWIIK